MHSSASNCVFCKKVIHTITLVEDSRERKRMWIPQKKRKEKEIENQTVQSTLDDMRQCKKKKLRLR